MKSALFACTVALGLGSLLAIGACGDDTGTGGATSSTAVGPTGPSSTTTAVSGSTTSSSKASSGATGSTSASTGGGGEFTLTSTAFNDGDMLPAIYSCASNENQSPPLAWSGAPAGALSFAIDFTDQNNHLTHWAMWDISPTTMSLPEAIDDAYASVNVPGAHQVAFTQGHGYFGPCPGGNVHTYIFTIHAMDVASVSELSMSSDNDAAKAAIDAHDMGSATLTITSDASM